jgi:hypothetical protein
VRQIVRRPEHADPVQADVLLARVVVDQPDRRVAEPRRLQHLANHELGRVTRADDDHFLAARDQRGRAGPFDQAPRDQSRARHEREQDQPVEHGDRARQREAADGMCEVDDEVGENARDGDAARRAPHVPRRDVAPPAVVEAERDEHRELDRDDDEDRVDHEPVVRPRHALVEAQPEREPPGERDQRRVGQKLPETMPVHGNHDATGAAACTTETTRSCASASMPAQSGTEKLSSASCSVTGSEP